MTRATWFFAGTTVVGFATSAWLYAQNRSLDHAVAAPVAVTTPVAIPVTGTDPWLDRPREVALPQRTGTPPALPEVHEDTRLERRAHRMDEFAAMWGRSADETPAQCKARVMPLIKAGLA